MSEAAGDTHEEARAARGLSRPNVEPSLVRRESPEGRVTQAADSGAQGRGRLHAAWGTWDESAGGGLVFVGSLPT